MPMSIIPVFRATSMLLEVSHAKRMGMVNTNAHAANCAANTHASFLSIRFIVEKVFVHE